MVTVSTESGAAAGNNAAPANAPLLVETGGDPKAAEEEQRETPKPAKPSASGSSSTPKPAGPSASPKAAQPDDQRRRPLDPSHQQP
jgi:BRCT domain type II-containing protein